MSLSSILSSWGLSPEIRDLATESQSLTIARVTEQARGQYRVVTDQAEQPAVVAGKIMHLTDDPVAFPAVGDWVLVAGDDDLAVIQEVLPRQTCIVRKAAGTSRDAQVIAANVDTVFICMALNEDFNLRRLERYLAVVWESRATPVVVLTKSDLATDLASQVAEVVAIAGGADVTVTSVEDDHGIDGVRRYVTPGKTVAFIGSSGVGKSTLVNHLAGHEVLRTSGLRGDGQGRHTTTHRQAILLPDGGILIDTPGMRELGLETGDIGRTFEDIEALAAQCRFADCQHTGEPGCAVQSAIESGDLEEGRFRSYEKLEREVRYSGMNSRQIAADQIDRIFGGKAGLKAMRKRTKASPKR